MTDFLRARDNAAEPDEAARPRRRPHPDEGLKVDPTVLQVARRLARGAVQPRVVRPERPSAG